MKKFSALLALFSLVFAASAEQTAEWSFNDKGTTITDGDWTFEVSRRVSESEVAEGVLGLRVKKCTASPATPSTLDFGKSISEFDNQKYAITYLNADGNWFTEDQKAAVGRVVLPTEVGFQLASSPFYGCTNLVEVTPFLPSNCTAISAQSFEGCVKLKSPLVYTGSASFEKWTLFKDTAIPSVDLSKSTVANVNRGCFANCTSLKSVSFPASLSVLEGGMQPFTGCTALEKVEFRSFVTLNVFGSYSAGSLYYPGCTNLTEVHFYDCVPETTPANVYNGANTGTIVTYLHISDDQATSWAQYTQGGALDANSTWSKACAGNNYANRPLVRYADPHAQIAAGKDAVVVKDQKGTFVVARGDGDPAISPLTVKYAVSGEATSGDDYVALSGSVTIPAGSTNATVEVEGVYTGLTSSKTLVLTLSESEDYTIVEGKGTATINVEAAHREIGIAKVQDAAMATGQIGEFLISRGDGDSTDGDFVVHYEVGGTAKAGSDYSDILTGAITIPAGSRSVTMDVVPLPSCKSNTTVSIQLQAIGTSLTEGKESAEINVVYNEDYGGWVYSNSTVTDGTWTFAATIDATKKTITIGQVSTAPSTVKPLDFNKLVIDESGIPYQITTLNCGFQTKKYPYGPLEGFAEYVGTLTLPDGLTTISDYAFGGLSQSSCTIKLPSTLTSVGRMAFQNSSGLVIQASEFPQGLGDIGESAFAGTKITGDLSLPLVTELNSTFNGCSELTSVTLGPELKKLIGGYAGGAFSKCTKLTNVVFDAASSVEITPGGVFYGSTALTELDLTAVTKIHSPTDLGHTNANDYAVFKGCSSLRKITFGPKLKWLHHLSLYTVADGLKEVVFLGPPPEFFGTPYGMNPTKTVSKVVTYPTITTYVKNDMVAVTNSLGKCWNDYCASEKIGNHTTFAQEYIESDLWNQSYHPDVSARPLRLLTPPGLMLFLR